ncbi:MAG TPA: hypothetical protein VGT78_10915 [Rhizomicrobium sp.]|nr:hypothetical protein [Rhizomicrobium sp.]
MSTNDTYLAVFTGNRNSQRMKEWMALPEAERQAREKQGMTAWQAWMEKHSAAVAGTGGPLGKTKRVTQAGIADVSNEMSGYSIVRAASHEAAAKMFEGHPHFSIFPGEGVDVMPILPIPGR